MQCVLAVIADDFGVHSQSLHDYIIAFCRHQAIKAHRCLHQEMNHIRINHEHNYAICHSHPIHESAANKAEATVRVTARATSHDTEPIDEVHDEQEDWQQSVHLQSHIELRQIVKAKEVIHALQVKDPIDRYQC